MSNTKLLLVFLTGVAAGVLFAPHRGEKIRRKIGKRIKRFSGNVIDKTARAGDKLKHSYETAKEDLSEAFHSS
jgi:gas vesicle protein